MANIKANIKNIRKTESRTKINRHEKTAYKNLVKEAKVSKDQEALNAANKKVDSVASKGIIHKNKANRIKSRLALAFNKLAGKAKKARKPRATKKAA